MNNCSILKYRSKGGYLGPVAIAIVGQQDNDSLWEAMVYGLDPLDRYSGKLREQWVGMFNSFEDAARNIDAMADYNDWESMQTI